MPKDRNFNLCLLAAPKIAENLRSNGNEAEVIVGGYKPVTPITTWDDRYQDIWYNYPVVQETGFFHAWVYSGGKIIDPTVSQFGVYDKTEFDHPDECYDGFGILVAPMIISYFEGRFERVNFMALEQYSFEAIPPNLEALDHITDKFR